MTAHRCSLCGTSFVMRRVDALDRATARPVLVPHHCPNAACAYHRADLVDFDAVED